MSKKTILVLTHYSELYGANISLINLLRELIEYNIIVVCPNRGKFTIELEKNNIYYIININKTLFSTKNKIISFPKLLLNNFANYILYHKIKNKNIDLIYSNSSVITRGLYLKEKLSVPHIWHFRENFSSHYNMSYFWGKNSFNKLINSSDYIIYISKYLKNVYLGNNNYKIIPNGIVYYNEFKYNVKNNKKIKDKNNIKIGIVGKIYYEKGHHIVIKSIDNIKMRDKFEIICFGEFHDKKYRKYLNSLSRNIKIRFPGYLSNLMEIYNSIDILISASKNEGMGRTIVEAMAYGVPVIAHNSGAAPEIIENGENGFLFYSIEELSNKILKLSTDEALYQSFIKNSYKKVESTYLIENYVESIKNIFDNYLGKM